MERIAVNVAASLLLALLLGIGALVSTERLAGAQTSPSQPECTLTADIPTVVHLNQPFTVTSTQTCPVDVFEAYQILSVPQQEGAPRPFTIDTADISPKQPGVPGIPTPEGCTFRDTPLSVVECDTGVGNILANQPVTMRAQLTPKECGLHHIQVSGGGVSGSVSGGIITPGQGGMVTPIIDRTVVVLCDGGGGGGGSAPSYYYDPSWLASPSWTAGAPYWNGGYLGGRWW